MRDARWMAATLLAVAVVEAGPVGSATADGRRPEEAVVSAGGLVGLGGSRYTMFFPDPSAAWQVAVHGASTWPIAARVGVVPEVAVSRGFRIGDREEWLGLAGLRLTGQPDVPSPHLAFLAARAGWGSASRAVVDLGIGADLRWPSARLHVEVELGTLLTRVTTDDGDTDGAMRVRATYVSVHLGVAVGVGF